MNLRSLGVMTALCAALLVGSTGAQASSPSFDARVENIATIMVGFGATNFEFDLYSCPAGQEMTIVSWEAEQPIRPGAGAAAFGAPFGPSTGEQVQHLTLTAGSNFIAGEQWVGSGTVACGTVVVPVDGSGQTVSQNGV